MALSIGLRPAHISTTNEHGEDYTVITKGVCATSAKGPFSLPGDSRSLVFDTSLRIVGMIFSGNLTENVNYITPCADLVRDIKRVTGARDFRIATWFRASSSFSAVLVIIFHSSNHQGSEYKPSFLRTAPCSIFLYAISLSSQMMRCHMNTSR